MKNSEFISNIKDNELYLIRIYDASVQQIWQAWENPISVNQWWGPRGFSITTTSKELKSGGSWIYTMHGPDGGNYPNRSYYHIAEINKRLFYDHGISENSPPMFQVDVNFIPISGLQEKLDRTKMEMKMIFTNSDLAQRTKKYIKMANGDSCWDRLAEYLSISKSNKNIFFIQKDFNFNIEKIIPAFKRANILSKWYTSDEILNSTNQLNNQPNLSVPTDLKNKELNQNNPNFSDMKNKIPNEFSFKFSLGPNDFFYPRTGSFTCDFNANMDLFAIDDNNTVVRIAWELTDKASELEKQKFNNLLSEFTVEWTKYLDNLEIYLLQN